LSGSISCIECGSVVPVDAPDGICPACLWQLGQSSDSSQWKAGEPDSTNAASTYRTTSEATPLLAVGSRLTAILDRPADSPPIIRQLGNYDLIEELGRGGMGVVFKAVQRRADRIVAVKLILGGAASGDENRERFQSEVQLLAKLRHPNIVPVFEVGEEEGSPYFSMEYMPGGSLAEKAKQSPLPPAEAARIVEQLATAVHAAHQVGVLHRDIKPGNVLLDEGGAPKLTDFGLAKRLDRDDGLTHTGSVLGTPGYMPPEQARGERDLTPAADVYSLGATLYALLIGKPPFAGRNFHDTLQHVLNDDPPRPRAKRPDLPRDLEAVCLKCLEKDPTRRYATAQALADDLARWQLGESTIARPQTLPQRALRQVRRRWRPAVIASALIGGTLLVVAAVTSLIARYRDPLFTIDSALRRGEKITLIGETRPPKWQRWAIGTGTLSDPTSPRSFQVFCPNTGLLELVPATHQDKFRLSAEFRHEESTQASSYVGVYVARVSGKPNAGASADRAITIAFRDDLIRHQPGFALGDPLEIHDRLILGTPTVPLQLSGGAIGVLWIKEEKAEDRPWRKVVIQVDPSGIQVWFHRAPNEPARAVRWISNATIESQSTRQREWLAADHPDVTLDNISYQRTGGSGLFIHNARAYFRNVVIEPLP
jgi:serine/threonine protein kinase